MSNQDAFLSMIGVSELGYPLISVSDRGFNVIVGSTHSLPILFNNLPDGQPDYADHPRKEVFLPKLGTYSSAAGLFQIKMNIFDFYKNTLQLPDFSPFSQKKIALQLIRECHALNDIDNGMLADAIMKCSSRWASFPASSYGQHLQTFGYLKAAYKSAGGTLAGESNVPNS